MQGQIGHRHSMQTGVQTKILTHPTQTPHVVSIHVQMQTYTHSMYTTGVRDCQIFGCTHLKPNPLCHSSHLPQDLCSVLLLQFKEIPEEKGGPGGRQDKITITITYTPTATAHHKQKETQDNTKVHNYMNNITKQLEYTD